MGSGATAVTPIRNGLTSLAAALPDQLRERISDEPFPELWISAFETRLRRGERDAVRLYPELLRMVGANDQAMELALRALGVSLEIAQRAVGMYREMDGMTPEQRAEHATTKLAEYYAARGKRLVVLEDAGGGAGLTDASRPSAGDDPARYASEPGGAGNGERPTAATIPGSHNGGTDAQGNETPHA